MKMLFKINQLCTPAYLFFMISMVLLVIVAIQNMMEKNKTDYSMGRYRCRVPSCMLMFVLKVLYIIFWTWVLNLMCKDGHKDIAWFVFLLPYIIWFTMIAMMMMR
jgi:hypothetical protein